MSRNLLNSVKLVKPKSSVFDFTHDVKLSCNMGELVPVFNEDCVPGDRWKLACESLLRLAPMVAPMMHRVDVYFHYFFVPYRLLWKNWENFITGTKVGGNDPAVPYYNYCPNHTRLADYLGIPPNAGGTTTRNVSLWHHAAYALIFNQYYRDQNLVSELPYLLDDGTSSNNDNIGFQTIQKRAWEHDYFTAALPFAQKGDAVDLPLGNVLIDEARVLMNTATTGGATTLTGSAGNPITGKVHTSDPDIGVDNLYAEAQSAAVEPTTIRDLRRAFKLQEFLERSAVGGTRYTEQMYSIFGVSSSDARLQRPEYITGSKSPVQISEVLQTSQTDNSPQGNMAGHGISVTQGYGGSYYCEEHGCIIGLMSVMPKTAYMQGIPKKFLKLSDRYQHFFPQFEHIGEQEIANEEVYVDSATPAGVFGYIPRYAEYKVPFNRVAGEFRDSLKHWHMAREFGTAPSLNEDFIKADPTMRVFAVTDPDEDHLYVHVLNKAYARRLMSKYSSSHL